MAKATAIGDLAEQASLCQTFISETYLGFSLRHGLPLYGKSATRVQHSLEGLIADS